MSDDTYQLLDSGHGQKLERFADVTLLRPSPQALWPPALPASEWAAAQATFTRDATGQGTWDRRVPLPETWELRAADLTFHLRPTGFGHVGIFPEQIRFWRTLRHVCTPQMQILNLFAYTGGSTLACAAGGARVTHCDASRGVIEWAKENAAANAMDDHPIRWILDDAVKFARREGRRGRRYHGIILDPPSFGRGNKGEVFKLETDLPPLLAACAEILDDDASFVLLSGHTPGIGALAMRNLLGRTLDPSGGTLVHGEMSIPNPDTGVDLPGGVWAAWTRTDPGPWQTPGA